jgi:hypothetical protein
MSHLVGHILEYLSKAFAKQIPLRSKKDTLNAVIIIILHKTIVMVTGRFIP